MSGLSCLLTYLCELTFVRVMIQVRKSLMVYFDDNLIYSKNKDKNLDYLIQVYKILRKESLFMNI
jgi:hypothetical protein